MDREAFLALLVDAHSPLASVVRDGGVSLGGGDLVPAARGGQHVLRSEAYVAGLTLCAANSVLPFAVAMPPLLALLWSDRDEARRTLPPFVSPVVVMAVYLRAAECALQCVQLHADPAGPADQPLRSVLTPTDLLFESGFVALLEHEHRIRGHALQREVAALAERDAAVAALAEPAAAAAVLLRTDVDAALAERARELLWAHAHECIVEVERLLLVHLEDSDALPALLTRVPAYDAAALRLPADAAAAARHSGHQRLLVQEFATHYNFVRDLMRTTDGLDCRAYECDDERDNDGRLPPYLAAQVLVRLLHAQ